MRLDQWLISAAVAGGLIGIANAQVSYPGVTPQDVQNMIDAAIINATPSPCPTPMADTLTGSAGTGTPCMARPDATRPTQVQPTTATTSSDGSFSGTWPVAFSAAPTYVHAETYSATAPIDCMITADANSYTGKCYQTVATTLPSTVTAVLGLVISPVQSAAAGLSVRVVGRR